MGLAASRDLPGTGHPLDERKVARLYRLGLTMAEIAGICQVSAWVIGARLDRAGVVRRARSQQAGLLPLDRAVRRYRRQPRLLGELAAQLGISAEVIAAAVPRGPDRNADRRPVPSRPGHHLAPTGRGRRDPAAQEPPDPVPGGRGGPPGPAGRGELRRAGPRLPGRG